MTKALPGSTPRLTVNEELIVIHTLRDKLSAKKITLHEIALLLKILRARVAAAGTREARLRAKVLREARCEKKASAGASLRSAATV
jgi:hypothetical protein